MAWPIKTGDFPWIFTSHLDVRGTKVMIHGHIWPIYVCIQLYMYIVYIYWLYVYIIYIYRKWYCVFFFHVDQSQLHQATLLDTPRTGTTCKPSPAQIKWWRCDRAMGHGSGDLLFWGVHSCAKSSIWTNYNDFTATEPCGIMVDKGNHPQMALIQVIEIL